MTSSLLSVVLYVSAFLFAPNMVCEPAEPLTIISAVSTCHQDQTPGHTEQEDSDPEV